MSVKLENIHVGWFMRRVSLEAVLRPEGVYCLVLHKQRAHA